MTMPSPGYSPPSYDWSKDSSIGWEMTTGVLKSLLETAHAWFQSSQLSPHLSQVLAKSLFLKCLGLDCCANLSEDLNLSFGLVANCKV